MARFASESIEHHCALLACRAVLRSTLTSMRNLDNIKTTISDDESHGNSFAVCGTAGAATSQHVMVSLSASACVTTPCMVRHFLLPLS